MRRIKIISIPPGFAPEYIRRAWVGIEIRLPTEDEVKQDPPSHMGIGNQNKGGYDVLRSDAIDALKIGGKLEAAAYWQRFVLGHFLRFKKEVCEVLD